MTELTNDVIDSIEELITKVQGVLSSKIVVKDNQIIEVHVLADSSRNAKQIARDVQSVLLTKFDIDINYKIISVAQIENGTKIFTDNRITFTSLIYRNNGMITEVHVQLTHNGEIYEGIAEGINTTTNKYRIIVNATINCLSKIISNEHNLILEDIDIVKIAKSSVVVIAITHVTYQYEELLIGSCLVKKDEGDAIVKATLDALNRRLLNILNS